MLGLTYMINFALNDFTEYILFNIFGNVIR